jgi:hypothetical protein
MSEQHHSKTVRITALYTQTARKVSFEAEVSQTLSQVINEAYDKLKESRRPGDHYYCHQDPRVDLTLFLQKALTVLETEGVCFQPVHGERTFAFDIEAETGGAA